MKEWNGVRSVCDFLTAAGLPVPSRPSLTVRDHKKVKANCVYFVYKDSLDNPSYIGKSQNLKQRLNNHHKGFCGDELMSIVTFATPGMESIAEMIYIAAYMPEMNCVVSDLSKPRKKRYKVL